MLLYDERYFCIFILFICRLLLTLCGVKFFIDNCEVYMGNVIADNIKIGDVLELDDDPTKMPVETIVRVRVDHPAPDPLKEPNEPKKEALLKKLNEFRE